MSSPLVTKLHVPSPRSARAVARPRLLDRLDETLSVRLTLVSAPAGYGKTTLLADWAGHGGVAAAWLALDRDDNDPVRFLRYAIAALQTLDANIGSVVEPMLGASLPARTALSALLNDLARLSQQIVLVLDDYHVIDDAGVHEAITFLLDHLPPHVHLVIATRADPPLPLARLRARGQLAELRAADLRFTVEEVRAFLAGALSWQPPAEAVAALEARTEGWIAGLQMAALSMRDRPDPLAFIRSFSGSHEYIAGFLTDEVLSQQPEWLRLFLLQTAILDRLSGPLCDAVTGGTAAQRVLEELCEANLFLVSLDDERRWFRYHQLFADLLRARLHRDRRDMLPALHRRAGEWHSEHGDAAQAIHHALAAADAEWAADLVQGVAEAALARSEFRALLGWLEDLPPAVLRERPRLRAYYAGVLLMQGRSPADVLRDLEDALRAGADIAAQVAALQALLRAIQGDVDGALALSRAALAGLAEDELFFRSAVTRNLGVLYELVGDIPGATETLTETLRLAERTGNLVGRVTALVRLAELHRLQGRLTQAEAQHRRALAEATGAGGQRLPLAGMPLTGLGNLHYERGDWETAERCVEEGIALATGWSELWALGGYLVLANIRQVRGAFAEAHADLDHAQEIARGFDATEMDDAVVDGFRARLWLHQGNPQAAESLLGDPEREAIARSEGSARSGGAGPYLMRVLRQLVLARLRLAQGRPREALALLSSLLRDTAKLGRGRVRIEALALQALAYHAQDEPARALASLQEALRLAEPEAFVAVFVEEGEPMMQLLYQLAQAGSDGYARRLLAAFPSPTSRSTPEAALVEPLSGREIEVLELVAQGLTNQEIGRGLVISLPTVKWHTGNIYGKLGVKNRTEAVAKARSLGVLPS